MWKIDCFAIKKKIVTIPSLYDIIHNCVFEVKRVQAKPAEPRFEKMGNARFNIKEEEQNEFTGRKDGE